MASTTSRAVRSLFPSSSLRTTPSISICRNYAAAATAALDTPSSTASKSISPRTTYRIAAKPRKSSTVASSSSSPKSTPTPSSSSSTFTNAPDLAGLEPFVEPTDEEFATPQPPPSSPSIPAPYSNVDLASTAAPSNASMNNSLTNEYKTIAGEAPILSIVAEAGAEGKDWSLSFHGLSSAPFSREIREVLMRPLKHTDVEIKPDGLLYLPEIKYRRVLNEAFGPGGWGMAPRGETQVSTKIVSREWALVCLGRLVSIARGEQEFFDPSGIPTATEACKSNALMRCCKDLGIASELWDPSFIKEFKSKYCKEVMVEHMTQKRKRKLWRKIEAKFEYPYKEL